MWFGCKKTSVKISRCGFSLNGQKPGKRPTKLLELKRKGLRLGEEAQPGVL
jgi:hypothetical protein